jgi:tetratricopeptide (TPR) repeat protein
MDIDKKDRIIKLVSEGKLKEAIEDAGGDISLLFAILDYLHREKRTEDGLVVAKRILEIEPKNPDAHKMCGRLYARLGRYSDAEYEFNEAIKRYEDNIKRSDVRTYLASLLKTVERHKEAERQYKKAIEENSQNVEARRAFGDLLFEFRRYREAEQEYIEVLNIDSGYTDTQYRMGDTLYELKRYDEAVGAYEKAYLQLKAKKNKDKVLANVLDHLGKTLVKLKRYGDDEEKYKDAISLNENHAGAHNNLGVLLKELGDEEKDEVRKTKRYEDALEEFKIAAKKVPKYAVPHNNSGIVLKNLKRISEAKENFEKAIRENPNFVDAHTNLGVLYAEELGNYEKAIEEFEEAIRIDPSSSKAYYNLMLAKSKRKIEDVDWWQTSPVKKIAETILVLILVALIFMALYSLVQPVWQGSKSTIETNQTVESYRNITITTTINNILPFEQTLILIGIVVLLLFLPKINKLKLSPTEIEFEKESPKEAALPELEK